MPVSHINSLDDPRLEPYRNLKKSNLTRWTGKFIAEGRRVTERLLASTFAVESVLLSERRLALLQQLPPRGDLHVLVVPESAGTELTGYSFHGGVLACGMRGVSPTVEQLVGQSAHATTSLIVACPHMTDPDNLGSLIRVCRAFGVAGLLLGSACCDPFSRRTLRVSMGSAFELPIVECRDLAGDLDVLRSRAGYLVSATVLDAAATPLQYCGGAAREVLLLGNEAHGLGPEWLARCDRRLTIPMSPGADSLNVTVAAGIFLHALTRSRTPHGGQSR
jgi:tRNA G18 (ribose-2'-O)-methylase SpoU